MEETGHCGNVFVCSSSVALAFEIVSLAGLEEGQPREGEHSVLLRRLPVRQLHHPDAGVAEVALPRLQDGLHPVARLAVFGV